MGKGARGGKEATHIIVDYTVIQQILNLNSVDIHTTIWQTKCLANMRKPFNFNAINIGQLCSWLRKQNSEVLLEFYRVSGILERFLISLCELSNPGHLWPEPNQVPLNVKDVESTGTSFYSFRNVTHTE